MTMNYTDFNPTLYFLCSDSDETTKLEVEVPLMPTVQKVKKLCHNDPVAMAEFFQFMNRNFIRSFMGWLGQEGKGRQVRNGGGVYGHGVRLAPWLLPAQRLCDTRPRRLHSLHPYGTEARLPVQAQCCTAQRMIAWHANFSMSWPGSSCSR